MEVYPYCGVGLCLTEVVRQARRPLQSRVVISFFFIICHPFGQLAPPTSNKLFWSLIALAPHSYDYKTGRMKKMKNREKCEKCEDFIHWDNHLIFLPYDFLALLPFCLLPFNPFSSECPDSPLQAKFAPKQQCGSSPPGSSLPTSSPSVETKFETCTAKRHVRPPW